MGKTAASNASNASRHANGNGQIQSRYCRERLDRFDGFFRFVTPADAFSFFCTGSRVVLVCRVCFVCRGCGGTGGGGCCFAAMAAMRALRRRIGWAGISAAEVLAGPGGFGGFEGFVTRWRCPCTAKGADGFAATPRRGLVLDGGDCSGRSSSAAGCWSTASLSGLSGLSAGTRTVCSGTEQGMGRVGKRTPPRSSTIGS